MARPSFEATTPSSSRKISQDRPTNFLVFPSICAAFVLFFLPAASHTLFSGARLVPHYRVRTPLNWLMIKGPGDNFAELFQQRGAARSASLRSGSSFDAFWRHILASDPEHIIDGTAPKVNSQVDGLHTWAIYNLHITATCYEYRHVYDDAARSSSSIFIHLFCGISLLDPAEWC